VVGGKVSLKNRISPQKSLTWEGGGVVEPIAWELKEI